MPQDFQLLSRNFIALCAAHFLYFGAFYLLYPTLPGFVVQMGGSPGQIGLVMGTLTLASVVVRPFFARQVDRYGRKRFLLIATGSAALFFLLYTLVQGIVPLLIIRVAHGIAHGIYIAAVFAYVADLAPVDRRGEVLGIFTSSSVVAMAVFPGLAVKLLEYSGSYLLLFVFGAVTAVATFCAVAALVEIKPRRSETPAVGIWAVARQKVVLVASLALFSGSTVYGAVITFLPVYAPQRGVTSLGTFFTLFSLSTMASRTLTGRMSDRYGRRQVVIPFMGMLAATVFLLPFLNSEYLLGAIGVLFGVSFGAFMPTLNALIVDATSRGDRSTALAFFTAFMDLGMTAGSMGLGLVGEWWNYATMYAVGGVVVIGGLILFAAGIRTNPLPDQAKV